MTDRRRAHVTYWLGKPTLPIHNPGLLLWGLLWRDRFRQLHQLLLLLMQSLLRFFRLPGLEEKSHHDRPDAQELAAGNRSEDGHIDDGPAKHDREERPDEPIECFPNGIHDVAILMPHSPLLSCILHVHGVPEGGPMTTADMMLQVPPDLVVRAWLLRLHRRLIMTVNDEVEVDGSAVHLLTMHRLCLAIVAVQGLWLCRTGYLATYALGSPFVLGVANQLGHRPRRFPRLLCARHRERRWLVLHIPA
jgi:hypothetical protein